MKIYKNSFFPIKRRKKRVFRHSVVVGIGGNKGDVRGRFKRLFFYLSKMKKVYVQETSFILQNPPFGYIDQDDFYNAVALVQTSYGPKEFLKFLLHTEKVFKRERSFKNAPRTLDLDIIFFDDMRYKDKNLSIPHPCWDERDSVLIPLNSLKNLI
jgi:2-amino-4-hydroxy-6-hydroxymethyldihydropteridine diphosphokinase